MVSWKDGESSSEGSVSPSSTSPEDDKCGLVEWIDPEWHEAMKNALQKIWDMYEQSIKENESKEKVILKLQEEKKIIQEKHHNHIKETSWVFSTVHKNVMRENYQKIMQDVVLGGANDDLVGALGVFLEGPGAALDLDVVDLEEDLESPAAAVVVVACADVKVALGGDVEVVATGVGDAVELAVVALEGLGGGVEVVAVALGPAPDLALFS
ncbi:hypothetical protein ZWY2020_050549 [Hordeum vulgare]|nr:hypothetical protein ZWY2020_050549 [Hordeum vulgare]